MKKYLLSAKISQEEFDAIKDDIISASNCEELLFEQIEEKSEIDVKHDIVL